MKQVTSLRKSVFAENNIDTRMGCNTRHTSVKERNRLQRTTHTETPEVVHEM